MNNKSRVTQQERDRLEASAKAISAALHPLVKSDESFAALLMVLAAITLDAGIRIENVLESFLITHREMRATQDRINQEKILSALLAQVSGRN